MRRGAIANPDSEIKSITALNLPLYVAGVLLAIKTLVFTVSTV
ncbi:MAG: hypothetical protein ACYCXQ_11895 [Candidatus Humimicrobiaceae bacterium]